MPGELSHRFQDVTQNNVGQLKMLQEHVLPIQYNETFYKEVWKEDRKHFTKLCYHSDVLVGAICCREELREGSDECDIYITTLGVLKPYRRGKLGSKMLEVMLTTIRSSKSPTPSSIYLHVQVNNEIALTFFKKFGFTVERTVENYLKDVIPSDCFLLRLQL